jgi:hypothetical protein
MNNMLKKHIILFEAKDVGWIAYSTTFADAKRMLTINATTNHDIFYIFECNLLKQNPYTMKLKFPLKDHYTFSKINLYKEEEFINNEKYMTISYKDEDGGICLDVTKSI